MARQKIPRELQEIAELLKHQGIDQTVKQQIIDQLTPEERKVLGCAQPKPASQVETSSAPINRQEPAPLKLVTSWPVQVQELELPQPIAPEVSEFDSVLDVPAREAAHDMSSHLHLLSWLGAGAAMLWPWALIAASALTLVLIGCGVIELAR